MRRRYLGPAIAAAGLLVAGGVGLAATAGPFAVWSPSDGLTATSTASSPLPDASLSTLSRPPTPEDAPSSFVLNAAEVIGMDPASLRFSQAIEPGLETWLAREQGSGNVCLFESRPSSPGSTCVDTRLLERNGVVPFVAVSDDGSRVFLYGIVADSVVRAQLNGAPAVAAKGNTIFLSAPVTMTRAVVTLYSADGSSRQVNFSAFLPPR